MKVSTVYSCADVALANNEIVSHLNDVLEIIQDFVVPSYPGKSNKQLTLDLVHPVLNAIASYWLKTMDWQEQSVVSTLTSGLETDNGTIDFTYRLSDGRYIAMEVQFGNGGRLERDFSKLEQLHRHGLLALGILVYFDRETGVTADSGLAEYEKAVRRVKALKDMPVCIMGVSRRDSEVVDLRAIPGIIFPSVLGGSGKNIKALHAFIAQAIIERRPLSELVLTPELKQIVADHAKEHVDKVCYSLRCDMDRILTAQDASLQLTLLTPFIELLKSTYVPAQTAAMAASAPRKRVARKVPSAAAKPASVTVEPDTGVALRHEATASQPTTGTPATLATTTPCEVAAPRYIRVRKEDVEKTKLKPAVTLPVTKPRAPVAHFALAQALAQALPGRT